MIDVEDHVGAENEEGLVLLLPVGLRGRLLARFAEDNGRSPLARRHMIGSPHYLAADFGPLTVGRPPAALEAVVLGCDLKQQRIDAGIAPPADGVGWESSVLVDTPRPAPWNSSRGEGCDDLVGDGVSGQLKAASVVGIKSSHFTCSAVRGWFSSTSPTLMETAHGARSGNG
ncbi:MAG TPA: hypothetical protein VHC22_13380, partial [Pirellulales bacterium]|nr:hypothetical protein [Pirellulales bacterium]